MKKAYNMKFKSQNVLSGVETVNECLSKIVHFNMSGFVIIVEYN